MIMTLGVHMIVMWQILVEDKLLIFLGLLNYSVEEFSRMSVGKASVHAKWIIGRVIGTKMYKTAKVRVTRLVLDPYLLKVNF